MILRFLSGFYGGMKSLSSGFYLTWGVNYARWGQPVKALHYLNRAAKLNTKSGKVFYQRGLLLIAMGKTEAAVVDFNTAIEADPNHMDAYMNRSMMHALAGRSEAAQNDVEQAVTLGADRPSLESQVSELLGQAE